MVQKKKKIKPYSKGNAFQKMKNISKNNGWKKKKYVYAETKQNII